ncbi:MAG: cbb3-type cytochrome c oxidase subunit II [Chthoniobacterales bacterium]
MKGLTPLLLGLFGTFLFSWTGLILIPNAQIGHLDPQTDEDGNDPYPAPTSGMATRGREVYVANGCVYCHSQQVRADYAGSDIERKWGDRRSAPRDYIFERPVLLGKSRLGPDLANMGHRTPGETEPAPAAAAPAPVAGVANASPAPAAAGSPAAAVSAVVNVSPMPTGSPAPAVAGASPAAGGSPAPATAPVATTTTPTGETWAPAVKGGPPLYSAAWHHLHLYNPRRIARDSNMPSYRFLYEKRRVGGERAADALLLNGDDAPPEGWEIVPTYDAKCLVAYLMSLDQSHALTEVKSTAAAAPAAPGNAVK